MSGNNQRRPRINSGRRPYSSGIGGRSNTRDRGGNSYRENKPQRDRDDVRTGANATRAAINPWQTGTAPSPVMASFQTFQPAPMVIQQGVQRVDFGNQGFRAGYGSGQPSKMAMSTMNYNAGAMIGVPSTQLVTFEPQHQQQMLQQQQQQRSRHREYSAPRHNARNRSPQGGSNRNDNRNSAYYGNSSRSSDNNQDYKRRQRPRTSYGDRNSGSHTRSRSRSRSKDIRDRLGKKENDGTAIRRRLSDSVARKRPRMDRSPNKDSEETSKSETKVDDVVTEKEVKEIAEILEEVGEPVDVDEKGNEDAVEVKNDSEVKMDETEAEAVLGAEEDREDKPKSDRSKSKESSTKERSKDRRPTKHEDEYPCQALVCHICDLEVFTTKTGFIRHLQGITHDKMSKLFHAKNAAKLELLEVTVKLIEMRQRDKCLRETGNRRAPISRTIEHDLLRQLMKPHYCCDTRFNSPFDAEEHKLTLVHLRNEFEKNGCKKVEKEVAPCEEESEQNVDIMIEEARVSASLCPINFSNPPVYDPSEAFGLEFLDKDYHYQCTLCKKKNSPKHVMMHCQSIDHYESAMKHFKREKDKTEKELESKEEAKRIELTEEEETKEKEKEVDLDSIEKNVLDDFVKEDEEGGNNANDHLDEDEKEDIQDEDHDEINEEDEMQDDDYGDINEATRENYEEEFDVNDVDPENEDENNDDENLENDSAQNENEECEENNSDGENNIDEAEEIVSEPVDQVVEEAPVKEEEEFSPRRRTRRRGRPSLSRN